MKHFIGYERGINLGGWLSQCDHSRAHYDSFITEHDIERIASWGLDHVRLPVDYELVETAHGEFLQDGFQHIDDCLSWCERYGLNMILDLHKACGYSFDESESSGGFFQSAELQNNFLNLWQEFAGRYGRYSDRLSFELLNEVVDKSVTQTWNEIAERAVKMIRQYAPSINILIGGVENNSIASLKTLSMPYDKNIVYNFHFYEPLIFTHQSAYWVKGMPSDFSIRYPTKFSELTAKSKQYLPNPDIHLYSHNGDCEIDEHFFENAFSEGVRIAEERNVPLYCGEYGVIDKADTASTLNWYTDINSAFEKYGIARAAWNYKEKDFGITGDHYAPILESLKNLF